MIHEADGTAIFWAMGVTQHCGASETSTAIANLLLVTGNFGRPNAGAFRFVVITTYRERAISVRCRIFILAMN